MNVGSFGAIQIEEWGAFESGVAMQRCNGTSLFRWTSGRPGETVEECVAALSAETEQWFIMANFGASLFLGILLYPPKNSQVLIVEDLVSSSSLRSRVSVQLVRAGKPDGI